MKRKNIDTMREVRLWIREIVVPVCTLAASTMAIPEVRQAVAAKATEVKCSVEKRINKMRKEGS